MLLCLSASHRSASFAMLERLSASDAPAVAELCTRIPELRGGVCVSTCNRYELYLDLNPLGDEWMLRARILTNLAEVLDTPVQILTDNLRILSDEDVPEYLFSVTSGLESVAVGEGEISGQVSRALEQAQDSGTTTARLERLFQQAANTSKGVKSNTGIGQLGRSLVRLAFDLATSQLESWESTRVLLVGTGAYAGATLKALRDRGVTKVSVYSPSGRAGRFAEREGVVPVEEHSYLPTLTNADLIVTCTNADELVLTQDQLQLARSAPGTVKKQLIIDLGMPRNVDPNVAALDGVELLDLETLRIHAPIEELDSTNEARCIVARAAAEFAGQQAESDLAPALSALREHIHALVNQEIERISSREDSGVAAQALRRLGNTLLHDPMVRGKQMAREGRRDEFEAALQTLYGIEVAKPATPRIAQLPGASGCPVEHA
ncbi:glutamyl-tRNA reductase [Pseudoclavibacter albus]|uniref:glutamyl-tRNA reductase n=1 Tax=Pseudoclavibacter albus TaxID=272241 RepID=UPI0008250479|nr:glutamyl-tRNA reductase [Pseudoclavibacter alba]